MRKRASIALLLVALLLCLPGMSEAQSCDGCGIGYRPSSVSSSGGTLTGPLLLPDGSAVTPSLYWSGSAQKPGFYRVGDTIAFAQGGIPTFIYGYNFSGAQILSTGSYAWGASSAAGNGDLFLMRDAANTLALRNGTAAQTFNIYNTYTDASNYERFGILWASNVLELRTSAAGTGSNTRSIRLSAAAGGAWIFSRFGYLYSEVGEATSDLGQPGSEFGKFYLSRSIQGSKTKALTAATPTAAWDCAIAAGARTGGTIDYCVYGADATDYQYRCGAIKFAAVNRAGTTTCTMAPAAPDQTNDGNAGAITSSTLTYAITCTDTTDSFALLFNAASGLAETTLQVESRLNLMNPATCTPQ